MPAGKSRWRAYWAAARRRHLPGLGPRVRVPVHSSRLQAGSARRRARHAHSLLRVHAHDQSLLWVLPMLLVRMPCRHLTYRHLTCMTAGVAVADLAVGDRHLADLASGNLRSHLPRPWPCSGILSGMLQGFGARHTERFEQLGEVGVSHVARRAEVCRNLLDFLAMLVFTGEDEVS